MSPLGRPIACTIVALLIGGCGGGSTSQSSGAGAAPTGTPTPTVVLYPCPGPALPPVPVGNFDLGNPPGPGIFDLTKLTGSTVGFTAETVLSRMNYSYGFAVADYDCDARPDISFFDSYTTRVIDRSPPGVIGYMRWGAPSLEPIVANDAFPELQRGGYILFERQVAIDVNGDKLPDIVGVVNSHGAVAAYINPGIRGVKWTRRYLSFATPGALNIAAADIDGDGDKDIVVAMRNQPDTDPNPAVRGLVWLQNPGTADDHWVQRAIGPSDDLTTLRSLVVADMNADGKLDVVTTNNETGDLAIFLGDGGLTWRRISAPVLAIHGHYGIAVDLNKDGRSEILQPVYQGIKLFWLDAATDTISSQTIADFASEAEQIVVTEVDAADIDLDGKMDVVFTIGSLSTSPTDPRRGGVYWLKQTDQGWEANLIEAGTASYVAVRAVDIDGDGDADIVADSEYNLHAVTIWINHTR